MNELGGHEFDDLRVGLSASFAKTITETDTVLFAAVSGDSNALHVNAGYAATTMFKSRIAHGMLSASVISAAIADKLPGPGSTYLSQSLRFVAQVRVGLRRAGARGASSRRCARATPSTRSSWSRRSSPRAPASCSARTAR